MTIKYEGEFFYVTESESLDRNDVAKTSNDSGTVTESEILITNTIKLSDDNAIVSEYENEFNDTGTVIESQILTGSNLNTFPIISLALNQSIFSESPIWTDISAYAKHFNIKRGRTHILDKTEAGTAKLKVDNSGGEFWRANAGSDLYPYIKPLVLIKIEYSIPGTVYPRFYGVIETIPHAWQDPRVAQGGYCDIECVDYFESLSRTPIYNANPLLTADADSGQKEVMVDSIAHLIVGQSIKIYDSVNSEINTVAAVSAETLTVTMVNNLAATYHTSDTAKLKKFPQVLSGTRLIDVLLEWGLPVSMMDIDAGTVYVNEFTPPVGGTISLIHIQNVVQDEDGDFFVAVDGKVTFLDSIAMLLSPYNTSQGTLMDDGTGLGYTSPTLRDESKFIFNQCDLSGSSITEQSYIEPGYQAEQGPRVFPGRTDSYLVDNSVALLQCFIKVKRFRNSIFTTGNYYYQSRN
jgi:hypothetical protein